MFVHVRIYNTKLLWEETFLLVKFSLIIILDVWEAQKIKLYGNDSCPSKLPSQLSNLAGTQGKLVDKLL